MTGDIGDPIRRRLTGYHERKGLGPLLWAKNIDPHPGG